MKNSKIRSIIAIAWGFIVMFALLGALLGKEQATWIGLIAGVMWVLNRIIIEAFDAMQFLRVGDDANETKKKGHPSTWDDDKG